MKTEIEPKFGYEKFGAYQEAIKFHNFVQNLETIVSSGNHHILDQLRRAATSIPLNIAEGSGKLSNRDKKRFYSIARGSALECAAVLEILSNSGVISRNYQSEGRQYLSAIVGILTKVCKN